MRFQFAHYARQYWRNAIKNLDGWLSIGEYDEVEDESERK